MDLFQYEYTIKNIELTIDKNYVFDDGTVTYLNISNDFINRRLPVIQMGIEMDISTIQKIYLNKDSCRIKIEVYEYMMNDNVTMSTSLYFRKTFSIIPINNQDVYITSTMISSENAQDTMKSLQNFEMYLIDMDAVNRFDKQIGAMFNNASRSAILESLFTMRDFPAQTVIASPPMQTHTEPYILLPLGNLVDNINTLNKGYGIYDSYPIIYHDLDYMYCINKITPNIIMKSASDFGTVMFTLFNPTDPEHNVLGSNTDLKTRTHYINLQNKPIIEDTSIRDTSAKFSTLATIDKDGNVKKSTIDGSVSTLAYEFAYNNLTNDQIINERMNGHTVYVTTSNCCVSCIRPYKMYMFDADTQYTELNLTGHTYRISRWSLNIYREGIGKYLHNATFALYNPSR